MRFPRCPRTTAIVHDDHAPSYWRLRLPCEALDRNGAPVRWLSAQRSYQELGEAALGSEVLLMSRVGWAPHSKTDTKRWIELTRKMGTTVICDYDDDVFTPACLPQMSYLMTRIGQSPADAEERRLAHIESLQLWDGITTTTPYLAQVIQQYTSSPVRVVQNAIDLGAWQAAMGTRHWEDSPTTIGWVGGARLDQDLRPMAEAWGRVAVRHDDVRFRVAGYPAPILCRAVSAGQLQIVPWRDWATYPQSYLGLDISCCPLAYTPFNLAKSPIKAYESGAAGAAVIASPTVYGHVIRHNGTGLLAETADEWEHAIERLLTEPDLRFRLMQRWGRKVREKHSLLMCLRYWPDAWANIHQMAQRQKELPHVAV